MENTNKKDLSPSLSQEMRHILFLALPVILGQLAGLSMNFVDTVMSSRAGSVHMAAVAVAGSFWVPVTLFAQGLFMSITPFVAQVSTSSKKHKREEMALYLRQGLWLSLFVMLFSIILLFALSFVFALINYEDELIIISTNYLRVMIFGVPFLMLYAVQRSYLEGMGITRPTMFAGLIALALNIPLNYILIFGKLGLPKLGAVGCAVATVSVIICMSLVMFISVKKSYKRAFRYVAIDWKIIGKILSVSFPSALALLMELSVFSLVALFLAPFGKDVIAGHQAALNVSGMLYMVPLGLSIAVAIRTGNMIGAVDKYGVQVVRKSAFILSLCIGVFNALLLIFFRAQIAILYTDDILVFNVIEHLLLFAAIYQIVDGIQIGALGVLRGYNDTKAILLLCAITYWGIAMPAGYLLTFGLFGIEGFGYSGFWLGMVIGLSLAALLFTLRIFSLEKKDLETFLTA